MNGQFRFFNANNWQRWFLEQGCQDSRDAECAIGFLIHIEPLILFFRPVPELGHAVTWLSGHSDIANIPSEPIESSYEIRFH